MHALHPSPRQPLVLGVLAFTLALLVLLAVAAEPGTWDFSVGDDGSAGATSGPGGSPAPASEPTWVTDPLAPPFPAR